MMNYINNLIEIFKSQLDAFSFGVNDFFDILIVSVIFYYAYKFIRDRRAGKLAVGVLLIVFMSIISDLFSLSALSFLVGNFFQIGLLAIVVIFQPEIRSALEKAGGNSVKGFKNLTDTRHDENKEQIIDSVCEATCEMAKEKTGALIVFENETKLGDIIASGTVVNADISSYLLKNIFFENTPLHDGAVILRDGRLCAAGCFLPLSENNSIDRHLGTRHRAAIGVSEVSDALVVVVSEETGTISVAENGVIKRNYDYAGLKKELTRFLIQDETENVRTKLGRLGRKRKNSKNTEQQTNEEGAE
ncbi:MAG: diadenylate cyclase CdaA [Clostridia bacterium]|nr:diadenylate cyclase CdaA [Clostridia bacterium]